MSQTTNMNKTSKHRSSNGDVQQMHSYFSK